MGFGTIAAQVIMFIAIISVASGVFIVLTTYTQQTTDSFRIQKERIVSEIKTDISITQISYDNASNTTLIYAKNTGETKFRLAETDAYIDGVRVSTDARNITVEPDTDIGNPGLWDPGETVNVTITKRVGAGVHEVDIVAPNGVGDQESFST
jgi:archaellum component FlaF (FlaF/FlaG flagellin family)